MQIQSPWLFSTRRENINQAKLVDVSAAVNSTLSGQGSGLGSSSAIRRSYATPVQKDNDSDNKEVRALRFKLQETAAFLLPSERIAKCQRVILRLPDEEKKDFVQIVRTSLNRAYFRNLLRCGSVWVCPVCSAKITEYRRRELRKALRNWKARGGDVFMLTLTVPHYYSDDINKVTAGITDAVRMMMNRKPFKSLAKSIGLAGRIRSLEVNYGQNGWHVHFHILLFIDKKSASCYESAITSEIIDMPGGGGVMVQTEQDYASTSYLRDVQFELENMWAAAVYDAGLGEINEHGVKLTGGREAADYVSKYGREKSWSDAEEMTKSNIKTSKRGGLTPFDLLRIHAGQMEPRIYEDGNYQIVIDAEAAGAAFKRFAIAFKGKSQLRWSKGLRDLCGMSEDQKTDQEIVDEKEEKGHLVAHVDKQDWYKVVIKHKKRYEILNIIQDGGEQEDIDKYIADMKTKVPPPDPIRKLKYKKIDADGNIITIN